jgi:hypothetical protein
MATWHSTPSVPGPTLGRRCLPREGRKASTVGRTRALGRVDQWQPSLNGNEDRPIWWPQPKPIRLCRYLRASPPGGRRVVTRTSASEAGLRPPSAASPARALFDPY